MNLIEFFTILSTYLIEFMCTMLLVALAFRYIAYRSAKTNQIYFKTFCRSIDKVVNDPKNKEPIEDVELWLNDLLNGVTSHLPSRNLRLVDKPHVFRDESGEILTWEQNVESFREFSDGKRSIIHSTKQHIDAFKSPHPPNYTDLAKRSLEQDRQWKSIVGIIPVEALARMLNILPGLFIVGGIFGTFIGITAGLPIIAAIDLSHLEQAGPALHQFVSEVAFSMNTSIAGIICSVTMTILNALFPLAAVRQDVEKGLIRIYELLWTRIHGDKLSSGDQQMVDLLRLIHEEVRRQNAESRRIGKAS